MTTHAPLAPAAASSTLPPRLTTFLAITAGLSVGNIYWAQPLLGPISSDLDVSMSALGWLVTVIQLGYAAGIFLVVPLGDVVDRRRLVPLMLLLSACALSACAAAPSYPALLGAGLSLGLTTVSAQISTPLAGDLASDAERGRTLSRVMTGSVIGMLLARSASGLLADVTSWRVVFAGAAVVSVALAVAMHRRIPQLPPRAPVSYPKLLASVPTVVLRHRAARWTIALSMLQFAQYTMFWTALTLLLSSPPFDYPVSVVGLFGLLGAFGVIATRLTGSVHDRGWSLPATGLGWSLALVALAVAGGASSSLVGILVAIVLFDVANQVMGVLNASRLFQVAPDARSRINTAMVSSGFLAGAAGSALGSVLWNHGGWTAVVLAGVAMSTSALGLWAWGSRGPLQVTQERPSAVD